MPRRPKVAQRRGGGAKLARAKLRHFFFTVAPDRLLGGALKRRHLLRPIELREITLHVPSWPERFEGLRIAHVSDFHLGELMPMPKALEIIERVDRAKPDLLACTGDVVDLEWRGAEPLLKAMGELRAPMGRYLVLGNHDHLDDPDALVRAARKRGLRVLQDEVDEARETKARSDALRVGGIDWGRTKRELKERVASLRERPDLLLAHNPKAFPAAVRLGIPLTLAGHTHGGQVGLPDRAVRAPRPRDESARGTPEVVLPEPAGAHRSVPARERLRSLRKGLYAQGDSRLFVNVGAGSWFPARVNCPAEILLLTVKR
ncbi:MAG: metallophosphoesterase [Phycisphaeraceae bacterium]|nr:metallophosphoesterase [Phycisphaeraceae bacterium]